MPVCQCLASECRRVIGDFDTLPPERRAWFLARELVAPYLRPREMAANGRAA